MHNNIKDGLLDKLENLIKELGSVGYLVEVTGVEVAALREMHCDICRLTTIQTLMNSQAIAMLSKYKKVADASSH